MCDRKARTVLSAEANIIHIVYRFPPEDLSKTNAIIAAENVNESCPVKQVGSEREDTLTGDSSPLY